MPQRIDFCRQKVFEDWAFLSKSSECPSQDDGCFRDCGRELANDLQDCPCQENCPGGCPCPSYNCPSPILVLNTNSPENTPMIIDGRGNQQPIGLTYVQGAKTYFS